MSEDTLPPHLGGQNGKSWTDDGALEVMWNLGCRKIIDVGCGLGGQVKLAESLGWESYGVDGDWTVLPKETNFILNDYTEGSPVITEAVDLVWCVEFLEHVEEKFMDNYMKTFKDSQAKYLIITHAVPGQGGHHHVNCQDKDYWFDAFGKHGFIYDRELTNQIREASTMKKPFIARTGLVFKRV